MKLRMALLTVALLSAAAVAQQDFSKVEIKAVPLDATTWVLEGAGGHMVLSAGEDAAFLVDDQYAPLAERIAAAIAKITPKPVRFVLNTHWHGDHAGGNEALGRSGAVIVAHDNVRKRLGSEQFIELFRSKVPASPKAALPLVTFPQSMSFHLNGQEIRAIHVPRAHTDGDVIIHFTGSDVIQMGDVYFNGIYPFIDGSSGGTLDGVIAACDTALAMAGERTRIVAGHGPSVSTRVELKAYRDMLATVRERIGRELAAGRKLEEIVAAKPTADLDATWGKGFLKGDKFVEMVAILALKGR